jgi:hypothetical protein
VQASCWDDSCRGLSYSELFVTVAASNFVLWRTLDNFGQLWTTLVDRCRWQAYAMRLGAPDMIIESHGISFWISFSLRIHVSGASVKSEATDCRAGLSMQMKTISTHSNTCKATFARGDLKNPRCEGWRIRTSRSANQQYFCHTSRTFEGYLKTLEDTTEA